MVERDIKLQNERRLDLVQCLTRPDRPNLFCIIHTEPIHCQWARLKAEFYQHIEVSDTHGQGSSGDMGWVKPRDARQLHWVQFLAWSATQVLSLLSLKLSVVPGQLYMMCWQLIGGSIHTWTRKKCTTVIIANKNYDHTLNIPRSAVSNFQVDQTHKKFDFRLLINKYVSTDFKVYEWTRILLAWFTHKLSQNSTPVLARIRISPAVVHAGNLCRPYELY